jgi:uncharacterized protein YchJ
MIQSDSGPAACRAKPPQGAASVPAPTKPFGEAAFLRARDPKKISRCAVLFGRRRDGRRSLAPLVFLFVFLFPAQPSQAASKNGPEAIALLALVRSQEAAFKREDIDGVMATIHPESPLAAATKDLLSRVRDAYDFKITITELTVESITSEEARVAFVQVTEKTNGPQFRNNRLRGIHIFRRYEGQWRFFDTKIGKVDYLESK